MPFTVTEHLFLTKIQYNNSKLPYKGIPMDFPPGYRTLNEKQLLKAQQNQAEDPAIPFAVAVYLFLAKNTTSFFLLVECLR